MESVKLHKYILLKSAKSADTRPPMETGAILLRYVSPSVGPRRDLPVCWVVLARACWSFKGKLSGGMEGGRWTLCCVRYLGHSQQLLRFPPSLVFFFVFFLLSACTRICWMRWRSLQNVHTPGYPEGCRTRLTFASFRSAPVWLINLAQSDSQQREPPKYTSLLDP